MTLRQTGGASRRFFSNPRQYFLLRHRQDGEQVRAISKVDRSTGVTRCLSVVRPPLRYCLRCPPVGTRQQHRGVLLVATRALRTRVRQAQPLRVVRTHRRVRRPHPPLPARRRERVGAARQPDRAARRHRHGVRPCVEAQRLSVEGVQRLHAHPRQRPRRTRRVHQEGRRGGAGHIRRRQGGQQVPLRVARQLRRVRRPRPRHRPQVLLPQRAQVRPHLTLRVHTLVRPELLGLRVHPPPRSVRVHRPDVLLQPVELQSRLLAGRPHRRDRVHQVHRAVRPRARHLVQVLLERRHPLVALRQRLVRQLEQAPRRGHQRGQVERRLLRGRDHPPLRHPRRDQQRGDPHPEAVELERPLHLLLLPDRRRRRHTLRRRHVVVEPAVLVVRQHEQRLVPLRRRAQRLVHGLVQGLTCRHVVVRVLVTGPDARRHVDPAAGVDPCVARKRSVARVGVELLQAERLVRVVRDRLHEQLPRRVVVVVPPRQVGGSDLVHDRLRRVQLAGLVLVPPTRPGVALRRPRNRKLPVRPRRSRVRAKELVEQRELLRQLRDHRHVLGLEHRHDAVVVRPPGLVLREPAHGLGGPAVENLLRRARRAVARVADGVPDLRRLVVHGHHRAAPGLRVDHRVAVVAAVQPVHLRLRRPPHPVVPPEHVVEAAVLLHQDDHVLDLARARPVGTRLRRPGGSGRQAQAHSCGSHSDSACERRLRQ
eukprot:Rhum_TRINITY_DN15122_c0_g1::Rhum_TRINITY_DN15122_c0_g1_i1::g.139195::m.139195